MVLQHAGRPQPQGFHLQRPHPNPARIAGIAGAVALNLAVLMALMLPTEIPLVVPKPATVTEIVELDRKKVEPTPPPPVTVKVVKPDTVVKPQPQTAIPVPVLAPVQDQVLVDQGILAADSPALPAADAPIDIAPPAGPIPGVKLQYAAAPAPKYPLDQMKNGVQGTVLLQVLVDVDGKPLEVTIHQSSGDRQLDRAAQQQVLRKWTFRPAMKDGRAVQAIGIVPIDFKLG